MSFLAKFVRDPLIHFLVLGLGLFLLHGMVSSDGPDIDDPTEIVVDRDALLTFVQYRTKAFEPEIAAARLDKMSEPELKRLIRDFVREEALYREAKALGLGRDDYVIKQRMIQKIDFISQGFADAVVTVGDDDVKAYHAANKARYRVPAFITFTHVFFHAEDRAASAATALADAKLAELRNGGAAFSDAPKHGDRFPYGVNYVESTREHVESHFGREMTDALFALKPEDGLWHGPFRSPYGAHLVMVVKREEARDPDLETVRSRVDADLMDERKRQQAEKAIRSIIDRYSVNLRLSGTSGRDGGAEGS